MIDVNKLKFGDRIATLWREWDIDNEKLSLPFYVSNYHFVAAVQEDGKTYVIAYSFAHDGPVMEIFLRDNKSYDERWPAHLSSHLDLFHVQDCFMTRDEAEQVMDEEYRAAKGEALSPQ